MTSSTSRMGRLWWGGGAVIILLTSLAVAQRAAAGLPAGDGAPPDFDAHHLAFQVMFVATTLAAVAMMVLATAVESLVGKKRDAGAKVALALGLTAAVLLVLLSGFLIGVEELPWTSALTKTFRADGMRAFAAIGLQLYQGGIAIAGWLIAFYLLAVGAFAAPPRRSWWWLSFFAALFAAWSADAGWQTRSAIGAELMNAEGDASCSAGVTDAQLSTLRAWLQAAAAEQPSPSDVRVFYSSLYDPANDVFRSGTEHVDSRRASGSLTARRAAVDIRKRGFVAESAGIPVLLMPDVSVIRSAAFLNEYCLTWDHALAGRTWVVGVRFAPRKPVKGRLDVTGAIWFDSLTNAPAEIEFTYKNLWATPGFDDDGTPDHGQALARPQGNIIFERTPDGGAQIGSWHVRSPIMGRDSVRLSDATWLVTRRMFALESGGYLRAAR